MKLYKFAWAIALPLLGFSGLTVAQGSSSNAIESINVARQGNEVAVKIDLREPLSSPPAGFSVAKPAKVALDFPATANALGKSAMVVNEGDLSSLNIVQVGERTRVVLNLAKSLNYTTRVEGKSLFVTLAPVVRLTDSAAQANTRFAEERIVGVKHAVRDVNFRRGKDGEARIIVDLSDAGTGIDIRQQGTSLVVDFIKTAVPEHLRRKLDVDDFATPVSQVETKAFGENARMTITPKGVWEHNAYQTDNQFVVEVKRVVEDPNKLVQGSKIGYQGPRISINYQNGDVRALLRLMAEELGLNAVISETVTGTTTLVLKDVPADQVIDIIFQQKGLDMRKKGNIIMIAPRDEIATREKLDFESKQQISELEPLRMEQFVLNYQKASDVARLLAGLPVAGGAPVPTAGAGGANVQRILGKRGSAVADPQSNLLFVNDTAAKLDEVRAFIKAIDVVARQVMIEARVVEASDSFRQNVGMRLNFLGQGGVQLGGAGGMYLGAGQRAPIIGQTATVTAPTGASNSGAVNSIFTGTNSGQQNATGGWTGGTQTGFTGAGVNLPGFSNAGGTMAISLFSSSLSRIINLELAALEADGIGKMISSPRVITANNVKAKIEDGTEVPVTTPSSANQPATVTFKSAKLSLEVTPQITPEGTIKMVLLVRKEEPDWARSVNGNPPIKSSVIETNVVVDNGGTVVIGGVYVNDNQNVVEKVPLLGDIPFLGWLFKYKTNSTNKRELLVFVTPKIVSERLSVQ